MDPSGRQAAVTSHMVTAVDPSGRQEGSATGTSSPITVTGLTNGQQYQFRMTATNAAGEGKPSAWSDPVTVGGSPPTLDDGPAHTGFVGHPYLSSFAVRGMQGSRVTLESGMIPPGLTLGQDGTLEGTPTRAGEYKFGVRATNRFGYHRGVATVTISETGAPHPETSWQHVRAKICTTGASDGPECATRSLFGPFAGLEGRAAARLVRGLVTYATGHGHATAGDRGLTLRRRCEPPLEERRCEPPPAGRYTLELLRPDHRSIFVPVTLH